MYCILKSQPYLRDDEEVEAEEYESCVDDAVICVDGCQVKAESDGETGC